MNGYGLVVSLAISLSVLLGAQRLRRFLPIEIVADAAFYILFSSLIGARFYHVVNYFSYYSRNPEMVFQIWRGGLAIYGGLAAGVATAIIYYIKNRRRFDRPLLAYFDVVVPFVPLGQALGRVGNILNGENRPYAEWEIVLNLFIFLVLIFLERSQRLMSKKVPGRLSAFYLISYSGGRFLLEFFRKDSPWTVVPLTSAQWVSLMFFSISILTLFRTSRRG